jgi:hypothetical protein
MSFRSLIALLPALLLLPSVSPADDKPAPSATEKTLAVTPTWRSCQSNYFADDGILSIGCESLLLAEVRELAGPPAQKMLDELAKELAKELGAPAEPRKLQLGKASRSGVRLLSHVGGDPKGPGLVTLVALVPGRTGKSLLMTCGSTEALKVESTCEEIFTFFAAQPDLAAYKAEAHGARWGEELRDDANDARVRKILDATQASPDSLRPMFADAVVVGPGLWYRLLPQDAALGTIGTPSAYSTPAGPVPMRTYKADAVGQFLRSKGATALFKRFAPGKVRPATTNEREAFHATVPYEIEHKPLSVADCGKEALFLDLDDGKVVWLELISMPDRPVPDWCSAAGKEKGKK